jgi:hypothetical protein
METLRALQELDKKKKGGFYVRIVQTEFELWVVLWEGKGDMLG